MNCGLDFFPLSLGSLLFLSPSTNTIIDCHVKFRCQKPSPMLFVLIVSSWLRYCLFCSYQQTYQPRPLGTRPKPLNASFFFCFLHFPFCVVFSSFFLLSLSLVGGAFIPWNAIVVASGTRWYRTTRYSSTVPSHTDRYRASLSRTCSWPSIDTLSCFVFFVHACLVATGEISGG